MPASGVQALGIKKAGSTSPTVLLDLDKALKIEHNNYVSFVDSKLAPKGAEAIIAELFGSKEAFQKTSFLTFETLNPALVLSPGEQIRLNSITEPTEKLRFLQSKMKWEYPIILDAQGNPERDADNRIKRNRDGQLVLSKYNDSPIYRGTLFINDLEVSVGEKVKLSAFKNYRVGIDAETDERVYEEGTFAQLARVAQASTNVEALAAQASATPFIKAGATAAPVTGAKPVEHAAPVDKYAEFTEEQLRATLIATKPELAQVAAGFNRQQLAAMLQ
jgi:hypothetical protein